MNTRLEVPHLPRYYREQNNSLEDRPPLDTIVGRLSGVSMCPLTNNDVLLLILDCSDAMRQGPNLALDGRDNICPL